MLLLIFHEISETKNVSRAELILHATTLKFHEVAFEVAITLEFTFFKNIEVACQMKTIQDVNLQASVFLF